MVRRASPRVTPSARPRRSSCGGSWSRRTRACGGCSACCGAACRRRSSARRPGSPPGSSPRWAGTWRSNGTWRPIGERLADAGDPEAAELLATVKRAGFGDKELAGLAGTTPDALRAARLVLGIVPGYAMVDTCAAEFAAETPYFYATYAAAGSAPEAPPVERPAALVIGCGPVRIGQGIEFDYCAVQAADTLRRSGWQAVMINSNPETVSTDFDASSRLYFEPLDPESVRSVIDAESPSGCGPPAGRRRVRRPDAAQPRRAPGRRWACRCSAATSRRSTRPRSASASPPCSTDSGSRSPRAAWPTASRRR